MALDALGVGNDPIADLLASTGRQSPGRPKPLRTPIVTVGAPKSIGTPVGEVARLATAPDLATRISTALWLAQHGAVPPEVAAQYNKAVDARTPMSLPQGLISLAVQGASENVVPETGNEQAGDVVEKLARSGVDVSKYGPALAGARVAGFVGGGLAMFPHEVESAVEQGGSRAIRLAYRMAKGGAQMGTLAGEGAMLTGQQPGEAARNIATQAAAGAAFTGLGAPETRQILEEGAGAVGRAAGHALAPSTSGSGTALSGGRAAPVPDRLRLIRSAMRGEEPLPVAPDVPPTPQAVISARAAIAAELENTADPMEREGLLARDRALQLQQETLAQQPAATYQGPRLATNLAMTTEQARAAATAQPGEAAPTLEQVDAARAQLRREMLTVTDPMQREELMARDRSLEMQRELIERPVKGGLQARVGAVGDISKVKKPGAEPPPRPAIEHAASDRAPSNDAGDIEAAREAYESATDNDWNSLSADEQRALMHEAADRRVAAAQGSSVETPTTNQSFQVTPELQQAVAQRGRPLGFAHPAVVRTLAGGAAGAAAGAAIGDTPEERKRYAILGLGLGAGLAAGIPPAWEQAGPTVRQGLTDIYAPIRDVAPELHETLHASGAMPPISARRFVGAAAERSVKDLTGRQRELFGRRILLDNLEAEAERKSGAARAAAEEAAAGAADRTEPAKSARGLWYSSHTAGGHLRPKEELETDPLLQELARRSEASDRYFKDTRRFGPSSAVTQRNEVAIYDIQRILEERDHLDEEDIWREVKRRREAGGLGMDFDFGANAGEHGEPLQFPRYEPKSEATEADVRAQMLQQAAERFRAHADATRALLPPDYKASIDAQPWFQKALAASKMNVQGFNEAGAVGAGVDPASFRQPSLGLYMKLLSADRLREQQIRSVQHIEAEHPGATTPRTGFRLKLEGQKPAAQRLTPRGAEGPQHGPASVIREKPAIRNLPPGTAASGSKVMATGAARHYLEDFPSVAAEDAADKVSKAQRNAVYRAIEKIPNAELPPTENAPPGKRVLMFNDLQQLVPPPPEGSEIPKGFRRFAVPTEVAKAVDQYQRQVRGQTGAGHAVRRAMGAVTRSVLLNPAAAGGHALTLASSVGTDLPADAGLARALVTGIPGAKIVSTLERMRRVDFSNPATVARLQRLAREGALRISPDETGGWLNKGHHILFGPTGIDPRARIVASENFEARARQVGLKPNDPLYNAMERDYIVEHAGNYVGRNSGAATQWLQDAGITPFIAINRGKYGTAFKAVAGRSGAPVAPGLEGAWQRLAVAARGPVGTALALAGLSYVLSGHKNTENAPGHEEDIATGVYHLPGRDGTFNPYDLSSYRYFRGSPDEAAQRFGRYAKEVYVRRGMVDPTSTAAMRILEPIAYSRLGDKASETLRAGANAVLNLVGPAPDAAFNMLTGHALYLDRDGELGNIDGIHLQKDEGLKERALQSLRDINAGASLTIPAQGQAFDAGPSAVLGSLKPTVEARAGSAPRLAQMKYEEGQWQDAVVGRIYRARTREERLQVMNEALAEAKREGYTGPKLRATLQRAVNKAAVDRSPASMQRFLNQIKGRAPAAAPDPIEQLLRGGGR